MKFFQALFFLLLLVTPLLAGVSSVEDSVEGEEDVVSEDTSAEEEAEDAKVEESIVTDVVGGDKEQEDAPIVDGVPSGSKNVETELLFIQPPYTKRGSGAGVELPANKQVRILVSFTNTEIESQQQNNDYKLDFIEGFLRYPSDYSYYLQNFTARSLDLLVEPKREATIEYSFIPAQQLAGRPFGLTLRIGYHNNAGKLFTSTFFNDTIQIIEVDEGFDTESLFLYLLVTAVLGLVLFGLYHLFTVYALKKFKKSGVSKPAVAEQQVNSDIDLQWIPAEHLKIRQSPTISPRKRKSRRNDDNHTTGGH